MNNIAQRLNPTEILMAYDVIEGTHQKTPLIPFGLVHEDGFEVDIYAKMDTLNPGGSFKDRGSLYFVDKAIRSKELRKGDVIVTASAGNHAKGVAKAARDYGLNAIIFMSDQTPKTKIDGTKELGAEVILVEGDYHKTAKDAEEYSKSENFVYVPAYEHADIILGQSTVVTETMIQLFGKGIRPDFFVFPYGGGGLANGGGFAASRFDSTGEFRIDGYGEKIFTYGVQAENFNTMFRSYRSGKLLDYEPRGETIADGIRVPNASEQMLQLSERYLDDMFDVTEEQIRGAIREVYGSELLTNLMNLPIEELRVHGFHPNHRKGIGDLNVVEGAAAAAFASTFADDKIPYEKIARAISPREKIVGVVIASGNNIDRKLLEEILAEG